MNMDALLTISLLLEDEYFDILKGAPLYFFSVRSVKLTNIDLVDEICKVVDDDIKLIF